MLRTLRPHGLQEAVLRIEQKSLEVLEEGVSILLNEARNCVDHVPGIMLDQELQDNEGLWRQPDLASAAPGLVRDCEKVRGDVREVARLYGDQKGAA